jgi:hypothetical protein
MFKLQKFKTTILDTFNDEIELVLPLVSSYNGKPFDFQDLAARFTLDSIGKIAFGLNLECLFKPEVQFAKHFDYCTKSVNDSVINPFWLFARLFTPSGWKYFFYLRQLDIFAYNTIRAWRSRSSQSESDDLKGDLLRFIL